MPLSITSSFKAAGSDARMHRDNYSLNIRFMKCLKTGDNSLKEQEKAACIFVCGRFLTRCV